MKPKTIVVRAPNWLGDVAMSLPFLVALREQQPHARIHVILKPEHEAALELLPDLHIQTHRFHKRKQRGIVGLYRFARDLRRQIGSIDRYFALPPSTSAALMGMILGAKERIGYGRQGRELCLNRHAPWPAGLHRSREYLQLLSLASDVPASVNSWEPKPELTEVSVPEHFVVLNPNSIAPSRRLPDEQWVRLAGHFSDYDFVLTGAANDQERVDALTARLREAAPDNRYHNLAGRTTVLDLLTLFARAKAVISCDSGPSHLAHLLGTPTVAFFGAGDPRSTGPNYADGPALILKADIECSPCLKNSCSRGDLACLQRLDFDSEGPRIRRFIEQPEAHANAHLIGAARRV